MRTRLLEKVVITSDLDDSLEKRGVHCSVEDYSVMKAASMLVWVDAEEVQCSAREERTKGKKKRCIRILKV